MNNYSNSKIYLIKFKDNNKLIYIGSTINTLEEQFNNYKSKYNSNLDNCYIELYMNYPCKNKKELDDKEREIINDYKYNKKYVIVNFNSIVKKQQRENKRERQRKIQEQKEQLYIEYSTKLREIEDILMNTVYIPLEIRNKYNKDRIKIINDYKSAFKQLSGLKEQKDDEQ